MGREDNYLAILERTQQMWSVASRQEWDALAGLERQRADLVAALLPIEGLTPPLEPAMARRIAGIIGQIEEADGKIIEQVEVWQKHVRILLRLDKPEVT